MLQTLIFDTVTGLPVHILLIHAVVVGVPLMSLVTVAVAARPAWRDRFGWIVVALDVGLLLVVWATAQAGQALEARLARIGGVTPQVEQHISYGEWMWAFAAGLVVAAAVSAVAGRRRGPGRAALALSVVAALAALYWVFVTGEAGSQAVWGPIVDATQP